MKFHFGSWESYSIANSWDKSVGYETCSNQKKIISLKSSQNVNIKSELAFSLWNYELGLIAKKRIENQSQINKLTLNH
jgi:hypothetical protein